MTDKTNSQQKSLTMFSSVKDLRAVLASNYQKQIENYFADEKQARKFLSAVISAVQRTPKLLECTPVSLINSFMTMAQLGLMPSDVSGEAYVLPYDNKKKLPNNQWETVTEAQFQLGYQGLVTLFYRAGARRIVAEIVYKADEFSYVNGEVHHSPDVFADDRGPAVGAYVIVELSTGGIVTKVMKKSEILAIGERFSKSFKSNFTPWNEKNDPQLWMWKKTVLKQCAKLVPKNETLVTAIAEDNKDSNITPDRLLKAETDSESMKMGNLLQNGDDNQTQDTDEATTPEQPSEETVIQMDAPEGDENNEEREG